MHSYLEQYYRLKRWYKRLEKIQNKLSKVHIGNIVRLNVDDIEDEFTAFFIYCYHLKDWILRDSSSRLRENVEGYINSNECLRICADICNRSKHFVLTRPREKWTPKFHFFGFYLGQRAWVKLGVETEIGELDAFGVAQTCMASWKEFIQTDWWGAEKVENYL